MKLCKVYHQDGFEFLSRLIESSISPVLIFTDPPYGMNYKTNIPGDKRWNTTGEKESDKLGFGELKALKNDSKDAIDFDSFFKSCNAVMESGHLVVYSGWMSYHLWVPKITSNGFDLRTPIFWNKRCANGGNLSDPMISVVEIIIRASKGDISFNPLYNPENELKSRVVNMWDYGRVKKEEYVGHPTQKPLYLCQQIIRMCTSPGDLVVDPFCGSGTVLLAAKSLGRKWVGCDIDDGFCKIATERLSKPMQIDIEDTK